MEAAVQQDFQLAQETAAAQRSYRIRIAADSVRGGAIASECLEGFDPGSSDASGERCFRFGDASYLNAVGHPAIALDLHPESLAQLAQQVERHTLVVLDEKHVLVVVSPLRDRMRCAGDHYPSDACHGKSVAPANGKDKQDVSKSSSIALSAFPRGNSSYALPGQYPSSVPSSGVIGVIGVIGGVIGE